MSHPEPQGFHVRAVWFSDTQECSSLPIAEGQPLPAGLGAPDEWGVYDRISSGTLEFEREYLTRAEAESALRNLAWPRFLVVIQPDGSETRTEYRGFEPGLEILQKAVGGYIELVRVTYDGRLCDAFVNEEGKLHGLAINGRATQLCAEFLDDVIVGPIAICSVERGTVFCDVCGEDHSPPECNDEFPEPGDIRETGK